MQFQEEMSKLIADDSCLFVTGKALDFVNAPAANSNVDLLNNWLVANKLSLSDEKLATLSSFADNNNYNMRITV
jgi:hypothetical protein